MGDNLILKDLSDEKLIQLLWKTMKKNIAIKHGKAEKLTKLNY